MKVRPLLLAAAVALAANPSLAEGIELSGMGALLFGNGFFKFDKTNLDAPAVEAIMVGATEIVLQRTKLADLTKQFGGTILEESADTSAPRWLCYTTDGSAGPATNTWFISNALGGGEFVMMVAVEVANPKRPAADCEPAPASFTAPDLGIPGIGASLADLKEKFGSVRQGSRGAVSYRGDEPGKDGLGTAINAQYIGYIVSKGVVSAVGVGETSAQ